MQRYSEQEQTPLPGSMKCVCFFKLLTFLVTAALCKEVWRGPDVDDSVMLCKSYSTYGHCDAKHVLLDNSVFCSVFRNKILRGWCFLMCVR